MEATNGMPVFFVGVHVVLLLLVATFISDYKHEFDYEYDFVVRPNS